MDPLARGRELLESAVSYALASATLGTARLLSRPTPCPGWDLETLLDHVSESIGVLHDAVVTGASGPRRGYPGPEHDPVARLRGEATGLLHAYASAGPGEVALGDRKLSVSMVAVTGAIEITVHGWDISVAPAQPAPAMSSSPFSAASHGPRPCCGLSVAKEGCWLAATPASLAGLYQ
ncbi:MAG TPA: maleylpyruvate isomerase N-terminal domain-containing protein [Streptosporangiaceae bacterium]